MPLSFLYYLGTHLNNWLGKKQRFYSNIPVIIVGNLTTGGTGKTPTLIALAQLLEQASIKVGIISRGYKSKAEHAEDATLASSDTTATDIGDEPALIFARTHCPLAIHKDRKKSILRLLGAHPDTEVILSDDGLQNPKLARDLEIIVLGEQGLGNLHLIPAGPLRESPKRLQRADFCIHKGENFYFTPEGFYALATPQRQHDISHFEKQTVYAVAGIAHPERFFKTLENLGLSVIPKTFPDHHAFQLADFAGLTDHPIIMTEKDAVKCFDFALTNAYYLKMTGQLDLKLQNEFLKKVRYHIDNKKQNLIVLTKNKAAE